MNTTIKRAVLTFCVLCGLCATAMLVLGQAVGKSGASSSLGTGDQGVDKQLGADFERLLPALAVAINGHEGVATVSSNPAPLQYQVRYHDFEPGEYTFVTTLVAQDGMAHPNPGLALTSAEVPGTRQAFHHIIEDTAGTVDLPEQTVYLPLFGGAYRNPRFATLAYAIPGGAQLENIATISHQLVAGEQIAYASNADSARAVGQLEYIGSIQPANFSADINVDGIAATDKNLAVIPGGGANLITLQLKYSGLAAGHYTVVARLLAQSSGQPDQIVMTDKSIISLSDHAGTYRLRLEPKTQLAASGPGKDITYQVAVTVLNLHGVLLYQSGVEQDLKFSISNSFYS